MIAYKRNDLADEIIIPLFTKNKSLYIIIYTSYQVPIIRTYDAFLLNMLKAVSKEISLDFIENKYKHSIIDSLFNYNYEL